MPRLIVKPSYYKSIMWVALPVSAYFVGCWLQSNHDEDMTRFRNRSQLYGGRKESVW